MRPQLWYLLSVLQNAKGCVTYRMLALSLWGVPEEHVTAATIQVLKENISKLRRYSGLGVLHVYDPEARQYVGYALCPDMNQAWVRAV